MMRRISPPIPMYMVSLPLVDRSGNGSKAFRLRIRAGSRAGGQEVRRNVVYHTVIGSTVKGRLLAIVWIDHQLGRFPVHARQVPRGRGAVQFARCRFVPQVIGDSTLYIGQVVYRQQGVAGNLVNEALVNEAISVTALGVPAMLAAGVAGENGDGWRERHVLPVRG